MTTWANLYRLASDARCELLLLDGCLAALEQSDASVLHASVTAKIPNASTLCAALDACGIPPTHEVEAQIAMWHRFMDVHASGTAPGPQPARGPHR
jgi:hypothetical protein